MTAIMKQNKIKEALTNNIGIKVVAVFVSALIWLTVVNVSDPEKTVTIYNVPITITHESAITDLGMVYDVTSKQKVSITVSGKRSVVSGLTASDFTATASLKELSKVNSIPVMIKANKKSVSRKIDIMSQSMQTITVSVENVKTETYPIEVVYIGEAAEGFVSGPYALSFSQVDVSAPDSVHKKIKKVVAVCNLDYNNQDFTAKCKLVLYNKNNKKITNKHTVMSKDNVKVSVEILKQKEVPINVVTQPTTSDGYQISSIALSQNNAYLTGDSAVLETIEQIDISDAIDIADAKADVTIDVDLFKYIPQGIGINGESTIQVTVKIAKLDSKKVKINTSDIAINNVKDGLKATPVKKTVEITLLGQKEVLDEISEKDLKVSVDAGKLKEGTYSLPLKIVTPENVNLKSEVKMKVKLN